MSNYSLSLCFALFFFLSTGERWLKSYHALKFKPLQHDCVSWRPICDRFKENEGATNAKGVKAEIITLTALWGRMNHGSCSRSVSAALETSSPQYRPLQGDDSRTAVLSVSMARCDHIHCCAFLLDRASVLSLNFSLFSFLQSEYLRFFFFSIIWKLCGRRVFLPVVARVWNLRQEPRGAKNFSGRIKKK